MPRRLYGAAPDFAAVFDELLQAKRATAADVDATVANIIADVRRRGDAALIDYTAQFDGLQLDAEALLITGEEIREAVAACSGDDRAALRLAAERIGDFHERQRPGNLDFTDTEGVVLGARWTPLDAVGLYVPGGTAAYPSSVLMNAIPARVAGVDRIAMAVPTPQGALNPLVLAAADIAGVSEIYRIGGAQAIAAFAYSTETVDAVDKITGPGNAYVASAKKQVFGEVGIDMIAGPSEILVVADKANDPAWIAADLLSQAEHDTASQAILITDDAAFADRVEAQVEAQLASLPRAEIARESWQRHGATIVMLALDAEAVALVNMIAPEHLELAIDEAEAFAELVRHAGAIFLGRHTPEALGDYVAGPNHVLPTSRTARFSSGLGVVDFMKRTSLVRCPPESLPAIGPAAVTLAKAEGLDAHARSVSMRLDALSEDAPTEDAPTEDAPTEDDGGEDDGAA